MLQQNKQPSTLKEEPAVKKRNKVMSSTGIELAILHLLTWSSHQPINEASNTNVEPRKFVKSILQSR